MRSDRFSTIGAIAFVALCGAFIGAVGARAALSTGPQLKPLPPIEPRCIDFEQRAFRGSHPYVCRMAWCTGPDGTSGLATLWCAHAGEED